MGGGEKQIYVSLYLSIHLYLSLSLSLDIYIYIYIYIYIDCVRVYAYHVEPYGSKWVLRFLLYWTLVEPRP